MNRYVKFIYREALVHGFVIIAIRSRGNEFMIPTILFLPHRNCYTLKPKES